MFEIRICFVFVVDIITESMCDICTSIIQTRCSVWINNISGCEWSDQDSRERWNEVKNGDGEAKGGHSNIRWQWQIQHQGDQRSWWRHCWHQRCCSRSVFFLWFFCLSCLTWQVCVSMCTDQCWSGQVLFLRPSQQLSCCSFVGLETLFVNRLRPFSYVWLSGLILSEVFQTLHSYNIALCLVD